MNKTNSSLIIFILALGVFSIVNTEMGIVGIIPLIAEHFRISVPDAGWLVSVFALVIVFSAPITPVLFSRVNRKSAMVLVMSVFVLGNVVAAISDNYVIQLLVRAVQGLFHPIYITIAFAVAANSVERKDAPKAIAKVFVGVSAGMVVGVPITAFIGGQWGFAAAMSFFAVINAIVVLATLVCIPSMPVTTSTRYRDQWQVLKKPLLWASVISAVLMNGMMFGFYSYFSDYLQSVTLVSITMVSVFLAIYGGANIVGNVIAGRLLAHNPIKTILVMPLVLLVLDGLFFVFGTSAVMMGMVLLLLGVGVGIANNGNQYMVVTAAPEAVDFANGLFIAAANLGTTLGTFLCGVFISDWGTQYSVIGALLLGVLGWSGIAVRMYLLQNQKMKMVFE